MKNQKPPVDPNDPDYKARVTLAIKAYDCGCFIHSSVTRRLYTPREFVESSEKVVQDLLTNGGACNMTLHYPKAMLQTKLGILRKAKLELDKAEQDVQDIVTKLITAFDIHPMAKK